MWKYNQTTSPDELYHHGILGMKWGVRKQETKTKRVKKQKTPKRIMAEDAKYAYETRNKRAYELSNDEINLINQRRNLEANYKRLNPDPYGKVKAAVKGAGVTLGLFVTLYAKGAGLIKAGQTISRGFNNSTVGTVLTFGSKQALKGTYIHR